MGLKVNGARTVLNLLRKVCQLTHHFGFRQGVINILGSEIATDFFAVWDVACPVIEAIVSADNYFNKIDKVAEHTGDEDLTALV